MNGPTSKNYFCRLANFVICTFYLLSCLSTQAALPYSSNKTNKNKQNRTHLNKKTDKSSAKKNKTAWSKHKTTTHHNEKSEEEKLVEKDMAALAAEEARLHESKNLILSRAYQLYDNGINQTLLGNYKDAISQLKMATETLQDHGQENSALGIASFLALGKSAEKGKDFQLAKTAYEKVLLLRPQDKQTLLMLAKLEASHGNYTSAQINIDKVKDIDPDNIEAKLLTELINKKLSSTSLKTKQLNAKRNYLPQ